MTPALVRPVPPPKRPGTAAAFLAVLASQLGYREGRDNDTVFGREYGLNNQPWCAMFLHWGARNAGCDRSIPKFAYTPSGAEWFRSRGRWGRRPTVGALGFVWGPAAGGARIHHVFAVRSVLPDGSFLTLEGNTNNTGAAQGNGVYSLRRRSVGAHGGFGYPAYGAGPAPAWRPGDGYPGEGAFVVGGSHPAVPVLRRRLAGVGFGTASPAPALTETDRRNTVAYQRSRDELRSDPDGVLGPQGWRLLLADFKRARGN